MRVLLRCFTLTLGVWFVWLVLQLRRGGGLIIPQQDLLPERLARYFLNVELVKDIGFFFLVVLGLVLVTTMISALVALGVRALFRVQPWVGEAVGCGLMTILIMTFNSIFYPLSASAFPVSFEVGNVFLAILLVALVGLVLFALMRTKAAWALCGLLTVMFVGIGATDGKSPPLETVQARSGTNDGRPNVFIVGIDALRPKELAYFGNDVSRMPFLDKLLVEAEVFAPTFTPAARTFPAWVSVLSGRYPKENGARFNLMPDKNVEKTKMLTWLLQDKGYHTVWALDERRFNHIDETYGFDEIVGPSTAVAELAMSRIADFPPVNVLVNTGIGKRLLPELNSNRGAYVTYMPMLFNERVIEALEPDAPNFLAVHLTAAHYPFLSNQMRRIEGEPDLPFYYRNYLSMLDLADRQIDDLFSRLGRLGYLDNAVIYLVSDHGEGFPGIDSVPESQETIHSLETASFGHGTSVLMTDQFEVLLARLRFENGKVVPEARHRTRLSSLIDVAPDIAHKLGFNLPYEHQGRVLSAEHEMVFLESSFHAPALNKARVDEIVVMAQSMDFYEVNENGSLRLKSELIGSLTEAKQRAVVGRGMMVALYPDKKESAIVMELEPLNLWPSTTSVPPRLGQWRDLLGKLCEFYAPDSLSGESPCNSVM